MVAYNPKDWFKLIIQFHKSDTFRRLIPAMIGIGIYAGLISYLENDILGWKMKNPTAIHAILGFVLSMLLVFRTNSAYDRWWEGRKIWGSFVNNSRNFSLKLDAFLPENHPDKKTLRILVSNYVFAVKNHLRGRYIAEEFEECDLLSRQEMGVADHKPNRIAKALYKKINDLYSQKLLSNEQLLILNEELRSFTDNCGACERIKSTPIPYSYNIYLKKIVFIYAMTLPIMFATEHKYSTIPIAILVLYVFASIELIAEEIEDPFGDDENDLPTDEICARIKKNISEILP
ncbi:MAG: hypothetical protein JST26_17010 [Bacteroidetes bacterium]|nr:hypothetical protein [Bacteroidota bacterium]